MKWPWLKPQNKNRERKAHRNRKNDPFYNSKAWRQHRKWYISLDPLHQLCAVCYKQGMYVPKWAVDHIHARHLGGPDFPDQDGLQSLCRTCHSKKSGREAHGDKA